VKFPFRSAVLVVLICPVFARSSGTESAQSAGSADVHPTVTDAPEAAAKRLYIWSVVSVAGANALDIYSSYGKRELNPMLQGSDGTFNAASVAIKAGMVSAVEVPQIFLARHSARRMRLFAIANFAMSAALAGIFAHNFTVPGPGHASSTPAAVAAVSIGFSRRR